MRAETVPLLSAVKNAEAKILNPASKNEQEKIFESASGKLIKLRVVSDEYFCHSAQKKKTSAVEPVPIIKLTKSKR